MKGLRNRGSGGFTRWAASVLLWAVGAGGAAFAQTAAPAVSTTVAAPTVTTTVTETGAVVPAGCSSCSKGLAPGLDVLPTFGGGGGCASCGDCGGAGCVPGRYPCDCCLDESTCVGRLLGGIYKCICCPDPCYEPHWVALADAAFFQEGPRPVTQMNLRYEHVWDYPFPDKAEYLWARSGGGGKGPRTATGATSYRDLVLYNEVGIDRFSASVAIPYLQMSPANGPGASGFGDITIGTKSMLLDCELIQLTFAFNTIVPSGNFTRGLGTGHVSLEPAGLMALKLHPRTYLQSELAYRIPIGGDQAFQGPVLHYHCSLNHLLWSCGKDIQLIGVAELNGYELLGGAYTDPATGAALSAKTIGSIINIGPGVRLVICDKIDFGVGSAFNITNDSMGDEMLRVQFRWRF
jgi:hypothetical protein